MATDTANAPPVPPPAPATVESQNQRFIEAQLRKTSMQVKLVDLFGGLMLLAAVSLLFLLSVAVVDAWVYELGRFGRLAAMLVVASFAITYAMAYIDPLFYRQVNPQYAARMIEDTEPTLKNSLINFLTFQSSETPANQVVYQALEQRAATDLSNVPVESTVDRTKVIRVGYALAAIVILCGLYKILSPKDPFQTFARILAPFSEISRPARVSIDRVAPGDVEVFRGESVKIEATIDGLSSTDVVQVLYSTEDGQTIDAEVDMAAVGTSTREFECLLNFDGEGVQQSIEYRVFAGDAVSEAYRITMLATPTMVVESVEYDFPDYTKRPNHKSRRGDIKALEGTTVHLTCRTNHKIKAAHIEINPKEKDSRVRIPMDANEFEATGKFTLALDKDGAPKQTNYSVHFKSLDDHVNENPTLHRVEVTADLGPEVQILKPTTDLIEVAEDGSTPIEIRGIDPDYGLSRLTLKFDRLPPETLFENVAGRNGQVVVSYDFVPRRLGLKAGDTIEYHAEASDNKTSPTGRPTPNVSRTDYDYVIRITAPEKRETETAPRRTPSGDEPEDDPFADPPSKSDVDPTDKPPRSDGDDSRDGSESGDSDSGDMGDKSDSDSGGTAGSNSDTSDGSESGDSSSNSKSGQNTTGGKSDSTSGNTGESDSSTGSEAGSESNGDKSSESNGGSRTGNKGSGGKSGESRHASDEPLHDGEVVEKINEYLERKKREAREKGDSSKSKGDPAGEGEGSKPANADPKNKTGGPKKPSDGSEGSKPDGSKNSDPSNPEGGTSNEKSPNNSTNDSGDKGTNNTNSVGEKKPNGGANGGNKKQGNPKDGAGNDSPMGNGDSPMKNSPTKGGNKDGSSGAEDGGEKKNDSESGNETGSNPSNNGSPMNDPSNGGNKSPMGNNSGGEKKPNEGNSGETGGEKPSGGEKPGQQKKEGNGGEKKDGGNSGNNAQEKKDGSKPGGGSNSSPSPGQKPGQKKDQGKSGGSGSKNDSGSPKPQEGGKDRGGKQPKPGQDKKGGESKSPGQGKKNSSGKKGGKEQGDRKGGGGKGGGQNSGGAGNDSAGGSNPSDDGAGTSNEEGPGETGNRPGDQEQSDRQTGSKGSKSGEGGSSRKNPAGNKKSGSSGDQTGRKGTSPFGGGGQGDANSTEVPRSGEVADNDRANLEYARKATNLALEHLRDQKKGEVDPELLDELNMSEDDLAKFHERYERMMRNAKETPEGKRELDESLRSLGLRPNRDKRRSRTTPDDLFKDHADAGQSSRPPAKYADEFNAANKGISRAGNK